MFCQLGIAVLDRGNFGLGFGLAIEEHVMARPNQEGAICSPDRIGYTVGGHARMSSDGVEIEPDFS